MNFLINSAVFKSPNTISRNELRNKITKRSVNNTLTEDILSYPKKTEMKIKWDLLSATQLTTLKTYIDTGSWQVQITDTGYTYNALSTLTMSSGWDESYAQYKTNVEVLIQEI
jgi:hypothetical protein